MPKDVLVVSTTCLEVPPEQYGGVEEVVYNLSLELANRGHNVTCAAPEGTEIEGCDIIETVEPSDSNDCFSREPEAYKAYADKMSEVDIVLDHSWKKISYLHEQEYQDEMADTEILGIWHGMPSVKQKPPVDKPNYMAVSKAAASSWSKYVGFPVMHAYNGVDESKYPIRDNHYTDGDYFLTLNRINKQKGIKEFVQMCDEIEAPFVVAGEDTFVDDPGYVHEVMEMCGKSDYGTYKGTVSHEQKVELIRNAKATVLLPMHGYQEVFGLAAVESYMCGTPAVCIDNNGLGEVGNTICEKFTYDDLGVIQAKLKSLDNSSQTVPFIPNPETLRRKAIDNFSVDAMTDLYEDRMDQAQESPW